MRRLLLSVLVLLATLAPTLATAQTTQTAPPAATTATADATQQLAAAAAAGREILQLAADRNFNAMYDRMHPDAMAVVPRAAAVGAFTDIYRQAQAGQAQIVGVELGSWTWPVTGKTYPVAAKIDFIQPYVDPQQGEQWLRDSMYLVQADGDWRWFFGSSKEFVQQTIAKYGQQGPTTPITQGDLIANVVNDLDSFYRDVLSYTPYKYTSPGVVVVQAGDHVRTACGPAETGFWAFYCPGDATLYLDEVLLDQLQQEGQSFAAAFVIAHEWAHHVQDTVGIERVGIFQRPTQWNQVYSIELELMADCMAGAWTQDLQTRGMLAPGSVDQVVHFADVLGDPAVIGEHDPDAHGTTDQRVHAFMNGYQDGFLGCNIKI
ncbi:MAG TPA: neutral zinc metallopeptidase [Thermomicrobiales bacterium]|nr:neutral zinc metallopeptidase [Thermomicrobiales bacterium]